MTVNKPRTTTAVLRRPGIVSWLEKTSLRTKLIVGFVVIAAFTAAVVGYSINRTLQAELTSSVSANLNTQARSLALITGNELEKQIEKLKTLGLETKLGKAMEDANASYQGDPAIIQAKIDQLDQQWRAADAANNNDDPLVKAALSNESAQVLKSFRLLYNDHVEIFITDKYGALIATTNRTTDYNQADEEWWQTASKAIYVSLPVYDESSRTYACDIAMPVRDKDANIIGVLRSTYRIAAMVQSLASARVGETSFASLLFPNNEIVDAAGAKAVIDAETRAKVLATSGGYGQFIFNGKERLVTEALLASISTEKNTIRNLNWILVVDQDPAEITRPVAAAAQTALYIGLVTLLIASLLGVLATQYLATPITRLTAVARQIRAGDLDARARVDTLDEIGTLADSLNAMTGELQETLHGLERRVSERTVDLEQRSKELELASIHTQKRAAQFQAIAQVGRAITSIQHLDELLPYIAQVASAQLGFYHVGIFLIDKDKEYAVLRAANSEGGKRMLERGHKLQVGQTGIVGYVASQGRPRIALDTGTDAVFFNNPDLPTTHSEIALPLKVGSEIIGVLDVQSEQTAAFEQENVEFLSVLADQVSLAIQNARRFQDAQDKLKEAQTLYQQFLRQEWKAVVDEGKHLGYRYSSASAAPLKEPVTSAEIVKAAYSGKLASAQEKSQSRLAIPIILRGQTIGVLNVQVNQDRPWEQDEIDIAQAVAERVALAIENARLLESSQNQAARERTVGEITSKIGASVNLRNVLQTAVEELGRILPGSDVVIQFESKK